MGVKAPLSAHQGAQLLLGPLGHGVGVMKDLLCAAEKVQKLASSG
jgi:hypothetical protein